MNEILTVVHFKPFFLNVYFFFKNIYETTENLEEYHEAYFFFKLINFPSTWNGVHGGNWLRRSAQTCLSPAIDSSSS